MIKKILITTLFLQIALSMFVTSYVQAQDNSEVVQRANDVANFYDKNVPTTIKDSLEKAASFLEGKRMQINIFANTKVEFYKNKPVEITSDQGFSLTDVKTAFGTFFYYLMIGLSFISGNIYLFWGITILIIGLIFKRLFR